MKLDYHVILIFSKPKEQILVYDLSSQLEFPITFEDYIFKSFLLTNYLIDEKTKSEFLELLENT